MSARRVTLRIGLTALVLTSVLALVGTAGSAAGDAYKPRVVGIHQRRAGRPPNTLILLFRNTPFGSG